MRRSDTTPSRTPPAKSDVCGRLRSLAAEASRLDHGRVANRLSAFALLFDELPGRRAAMLREIEDLAEGTPNPMLAGVLREAAVVVRSAMDS
jgi:hypothetical protein